MIAVLVRRQYYCKAYIFVLYLFLFPFSHSFQKEYNVFLLETYIYKKSDIRSDS